MGSDVGTGGVGQRNYFDHVDLIDALCAGPIMMHKSKVILQHVVRILTVGAGVGVAVGVLVGVLVGRG